MKRNLYSVLLATGVIFTSGLSAIAAETSLQSESGSKVLTANSSSLQGTSLSPNQANNKGLSLNSTSLEGKSAQGQFEQGAKGIGTSP